MKIPEIEQASPAQIKQFQEAKLREQLAYLERRSPYYARLFREHAIKTKQIRTIDDLRQIPLTTKAQLQQFNRDFLCVEKRSVADYVTTSGTSGDPVLFALTDKDLDRLAYNEALSYQCAGLTENSVIQLTTTLDRRFMAGLAYYLGARKAGIGVVRVGSGIPELQWDTIARIQPDTLIGVPSFILKMIEYAETQGIAYARSGIRRMIGIGEPLRTQDLSPNTLAKRIRAKWDIDLYTTYASTEMSTAFTECSYGKGGHHHPELLITEFVDDQDRPVPEGAPGELVITTLGVEGMPLLRFKTGDILQAHYEPCPCGRTTLRLGPVIGRKNQMIKYKGTTIYPPAMFDLLDDFEEIEHYLIELTSNELNEDEILLKISAKAAGEEILQKIKNRFRAKLRVSPKILFVTLPDILALKFPENARKSVTFIDRRTHRDPQQETAL